MVRLSAAEHRYLKHRWPLLSGLRRALRTEPNVRLAILFGSVARGEEISRSDVDVLVDLRDPDPFRMLELQERLSQTVARDVQLLRLGDAQRDLTVLGEALKDGRVLVDREDQWSKLKKRAGQIQRQGDQELDVRARKALASARHMASS